MKQALFALLTASLFLAGVSLSSCSPHKAPKAAELLPENAPLLLQLPDLKQSRDRWPKTSLAQIWSEPEVQSFLQKPLARSNALHFFGKWMAKADQLDFREAFASVVTVTDQQPMILCGLRYKGQKSELEALLAELREQLTSERPHAKADLVQHRGTSIQSYRDADRVLAVCCLQEWCLIANDLETLKAAIDRGIGQSRTPNLAGNTSFQRVIEKMPGQFDSLVYVQPKALRAPLGALLPAAEKQNPAAILEDLDAVALTTKMDGTNLRDTLLVLGPKKAAGVEISNSAAELTSLDTLLFLTARLGFGQGSPEAMGSVPAVNPMQTILLATAEEAMAESGLKNADLAKAFEPEASVILDWNPEAVRPSFLLAIPVRDSAKARQFATLLQKHPMGETHWERRDVSDAYALTLSGMQLQMFSPTLLLDDQFLLFGLTSDSVMETAFRKGKSETIREKATYNEAFQNLGKPTQSAGFVDAKVLFERVYGFARPMIMAYGMFNPSLAQSVDLQKLPATETISRHLGPIAFSQYSIEGGELFESTGPITFGQGAIGIGIAVLNSMAPTVKQVASEVTSPSTGAQQPASAPAAFPNSAPERIAPGTSSSAE